MSDFKAKMYQIQFRLGSAPDPAGELTALPRSSSSIKGPTSKGRRDEEKKGTGRVGDGRGRKPTPSRPLIHISGYAPAYSRPFVTPHV